MNAGPNGEYLLGEGENLEVDPPRRLVQNMVAFFSDEAKAEGMSRITWEIEPIGDSCRLTLTHDQMREGANDSALRRLADGALGPQDVARDRRAAHDAGFAGLHSNGVITTNDYEQTTTNARTATT